MGKCECQRELPENVIRLLFFFFCEPKSTLASSLVKGRRRRRRCATLCDVEWVSNNTCEHFNKCYSIWRTMCGWIDAGVSRIHPRHPPYQSSSSPTTSITRRRRQTHTQWNNDPYMMPPSVSGSSGWWCWWDMEIRLDGGGGCEGGNITWRVSFLQRLFYVSFMYIPCIMSLISASRI